MGSMGFQFTASGIVGSKLGEGNIPQAKRYALVLVSSAVVMIGLEAVLINVFSTEIALLFTKQQATIELI